MIKIGIVDDHRIFLDGIVSVLSANEGFTILFAENNAQKALVKMEENAPDIVITDISMPEINGVEFAKMIRSHYPEVKILVLSMFDNMIPFNSIDGFILKDSASENLVSAINEIVLGNKKYFGGKSNVENAIDFKKKILSSREKEIIRLIANEYTTDEIAEKLIISKHTIEAHRKNIFFKLQVKNIAGLIKKAMQLGVVK